MYGVVATSAAFVSSENVAHKIAIATTRHRAQATSAYSTEKQNQSATSFCETNNGRG